MMPLGSNLSAPLSEQTEKGLLHESQSSRDPGIHRAGHGRSQARGC